MTGGSRAWYRSATWPCTTACDRGNPRRGYRRPGPARRESPVPRGRDYQGGPGPLLRGGRRADAALAPRPAGDDDALSRRPGRPPDRAEERARVLPGLDPPGQRAEG